MTNPSDDRSTRLTSNAKQPFIDAFLLDASQFNALKWPPTTNPPCRSTSPMFPRRERGRLPNTTILPITRIYHGGFSPIWDLGVASDFLCRVEKYRPVQLDDVVSHKDIITTSACYIAYAVVNQPYALAVERFIEKNRLPHLLFYGPPGTGKTSTILAVARRIYGADYRKQILEVNLI
jgi:hypothetical protein